MLKKDNMTPGTIVIVNNEIKDGLPGIMGGSNLKETLSITPSAGSWMTTGSWEVGPKTLLEIIKGPRKVGGINSIRVRNVNNPTIEGEVYWCELRASASMVG